MGESNKCVDCGFELDYSDEDIPQCFRCDSQEWRRMCDKLTDRDTQIIEHNVYLTAERDKYRDACERLVGHYGDKTSWYKPFDERGGESLDYNGYTPSGNGFDFARQVKAELEGIEGSEIEVGVE